MQLTNSNKKTLITNIIRQIKINFINYRYAFFINSLLFLFVSLYYIPHALEKPKNLNQIFYLVCMHISYIAFLAMVFSLLCLPILMLPQKIMRSLLALLFSTALVVLLLDTILYADFNLHVNAISLPLLVLKISTVTHSDSIIFLGFYLLIVFAEYKFICNKKLIPRINDRSHKYNLCFLFSSLCMLLAYSSYNLANATTKQKFTQLVSYCAWFKPTKGLEPMQKLHIDKDKLLSSKKLFIPKLRKFNYINTAINYDTPTQSKNILLIVIDAWRSDKFNADQCPNLWHYAKSGIRFTNHYSSGNCAKNGIFGLFYAVPAIYWDLFKQTKQQPLLINRLLQLDYQIGVFTSSSLNDFKFNKIIFNKIKNLRIGSTAKTPAIRDQQATTDWCNWYAKLPKEQPKFSFLFYDSVHSYDFTSEFNQELSPTAGKIKYAKIAAEYGTEDMEKLYNSSVKYVDSLIAKVLATLEENSDLDNTMVIITGDHGHELNDNAQEFWGHNSNLASSQVKVPFIIIDKSLSCKKPEKICRDLTSHYDLVPTIMKNFLGATNAVEDYSCGVDLFSDFSHRKWILSSAKKKYLDYFAIIQQDYTIKLLPSGFYQFLDNRNSPIAETDKLNYEQINQAFQMIEKFTR